MRKGTIFNYELRRLLLSKEYPLLLIATLFFSVSLLRGMVLFGTSFTAPFSALTFGTYCASVTPFLLILLLVLCARQSKASERGAETIIGATPMPLPVFRLLRYGAIGCAFLFAVTLPLTTCLLFYRLVFDYTAVGNLLILGLLLLLPPAILLFGAAMLLGNRKSAAVYGLLAVVLIVGVFQIPLPALFDFIGRATDYELTPVFIAGRVVVTGIGAVLILTSLFLTKKQHE